MVNVPSIAKPIQWLVIFLAVISVAVADVMLKKAASHGNLFGALTSPWFIGAAGLYFVQISFLFTPFSTAGNSALLAHYKLRFTQSSLSQREYFFIKETLNWNQMTGIFLALSGVVLINWP